MEHTRRQILSLLRDLAMGGGGYERFGVRGWVRTEEVAERLGQRVPEQLPMLHVQSLVNRADALQPGRTARPLWLYRISPFGARRLAEAEKAKDDAALPVPQEHEGSPPVFLPGPCVGFLAVLREAIEDPEAPEHVPGQQGWLLTKEIRERGERRPERGGRFYPEDVALLIRAGLVERRDKEGAGRTRYVYRVTEAGLQTPVLEWREPR